MINIGPLRQNQPIPVISNREPSQSESKISIIAFAIFTEIALFIFLPLRVALPITLVSMVVMGLVVCWPKGTSKASSLSINPEPDRLPEGPQQPENNVPVIQRPPAPTRRAPLPHPEHREGDDAFFPVPNLAMPLWGPRRIQH